MTTNTNTDNRIAWHALTLLVASIWGSTFVASKVLLLEGLTPSQIMTFRFLIAWLLMLPFCHRSVITNVKDEFLFALLGMTGGSLYFLSENTAVQISSATSTVALVVCTTPILTAVINRIVHRKEHLSSHFLFGTLVALVGVSLVVFNGVFVLDDDPMVILLSVGASLTWAIYSIILRKMEHDYGSAVITRKVFFWGVVTMLPFMLMEPFDSTVLIHPKVITVTLFLAIIASLGCFLAWNIAVRRLGIVVTGNYLYFNPIVSLVVAYIVLNERITMLAILGCVLTIAGVYLCNKKSA